MHHEALPAVNPKALHLPVAAGHGSLHVSCVAALSGVDGCGSDQF